MFCCSFFHFVVSFAELTYPPYSEAIGNMVSRGRRYMRRLEDVVIRALHEVSGLRGERVAGLTGVWVDGHKVAAIGVRATRWITYHGLALNVTNSLEPFSDIVPCGISDRPVTSVLRALGVEEVTREQEDALLEEYSVALLDAFSEVFKLELLQDL